MILAVSVPAKRELVIVSADNLDVQNAFLARVQDENPELLQDTDFTRYLVEPELSGFKRSPTILEFATVEALEGFIATNGIELTNFANAPGKQKAMLAAEEFRTDDNRTLAEVHGLVDNDPWDRRTDEEKAKAEEARNSAKKKRAEGKGEHTEDSWGGGAGRSMGAGAKTAGVAPADPIPAGALPQGRYFAVIANGLADKPEDLFRDVNHPVQPLYMGKTATPVASGNVEDVFLYVFADKATADIVCDEMKSILAHIGSAIVAEIDERGQAYEDRSKQVVVNDDGSITVVESDDGSPVTNTTPGQNNPNRGGGATGGDLDPEAEKEGGLRIRDIEIDIDPVTGEVRIGRVVAEKNMFGADMFHITLLDDAGEPINDETQYQPILKRAGLSENTRYLGWEFKMHHKGGIIIELGGAATLRMEGALTESRRAYTMTSMAEQAEDFEGDNPFRISLDTMVETYFRVDVRGRKLVEVLPIASAVKEPYKSNDVDFGCWLAYVRERFADDVIGALDAKGIKATLVAVDPEGEAQVEEGTEGVRVLDKGAGKEEPPAPWNDRAGEYYAMSEEDQKKTRQKLLPFLLYCLRDYGRPIGIIAHITPRTYFNDTGEMWAGDFPFEDLMPDNYEKYGKKVGVFQCKSLDLNTADFMLGNQRHMKESLNLMAHVNSIGVERAED